MKEVNLDKLRDIVRGREEAEALIEIALHLGNTFRNEASREAREPVAIRRVRNGYVFCYGKTAWNSTYVYPQKCWDGLRRFCPSIAHALYQLRYLAWTGQEGTVQMGQRTLVVRSETR